MSWLTVPTNTYLDHRHRNWVVAEEMDDVRFDAERGVALVHRERAEHIVRTLLGGRDVLLLEDALALPARSSVRAMRVPLPQPQPPVMERSSTRWRDIVGLARHRGRRGGVRHRAGGAAGCSGAAWL